MKNLGFYLINAFTGENARGNPACVVFIDRLDNAHAMQTIASDLGMPATTFMKRAGNGYELRWYAPEGEIDLCGHGSVAALWVLKHRCNTNGKVILKYKSGELIGFIENTVVSFMSREIRVTEAPVPAEVVDGFGPGVAAYFTSNNKHMVVMENAIQVIDLKPNLEVLRKRDVFGYVITAQHTSDRYDVCSRVILPFLKMSEDQATGSAHLLIAPYWANRLNKIDLRCYQASERGGVVFCTVPGDGTVTISGSCTIIAEGELNAANYF
ncbi:MAG: PhzF family phenazine biosynthesis protein [Salibacteraceae bacterium]